MRTAEASGDLPLTLFFADVRASDTSIVGGKGANLGALTHADVPVPPGFCITARAFELFIAQVPDSDARFAQLDKLDGTDIEAARHAAETMRSSLDKLAVPTEVAAAVKESWRILGVDDPLGLPVNGVENWQAGFLPPIYQGTRFRSTGSPVLNLRPEAADPPGIARLRRDLIPTCREFFSPRIRSVATGKSPRSTPDSDSARRW